MNVELTTWLPCEFQCCPSRIDRNADYGPLQPLLRGIIDLDIIIEQWVQLVGPVASLKDRMAPADVVMQRLANAPADRLAAALSQLGRLVKTIHIPRYIHDEKLRQAIQMQLNRGEFRHIPIQNHRERQKAANLCAIAIEIIAKGAYWFLSRI